MPMTLPAGYNLNSKRSFFIILSQKLTKRGNRNRFMVGFFAQPDEEKYLETCDEHASLLEGYKYDHYNREISCNNFMRETMCSQLLDVDTEDV